MRLSRVLTGLPERMMTRGLAAKAMRACTQETDRFNRQLAEAAKAIAKIVRVVESTGESGKIQVAPTTHELLADRFEFQAWRHRGAR